MCQLQKKEEADSPFGRLLLDYENIQREVDLAHASTLETYS